MPDHDETKEAGPLSPNTKAPGVEKNLKKDSTLSSSTRLSDDESGEDDEEDEDYDDEEGESESEEDEEEEEEDNTEVCKTQGSFIKQTPFPMPLENLVLPKVYHTSLMFIYFALPVLVVCHTAITHYRFIGT